MLSHIPLTCDLIRRRRKRASFCILLESSKRKVPEQGRGRKLASLASAHETQAEKYCEERSGSSGASKILHWYLLVFVRFASGRYCWFLNTHCPAMRPRPTLCHVSKALGLGFALAGLGRTMAMTAQVAKARQGAGPEDYVLAAGQKQVKHALSLAHRRRVVSEL